jgi:hypothetical protein
MPGVFEAEPHLHGESARDRGAQGPQDAVDLGGLAQQTAAHILLVNLRRGAAQIEVDAGDVVPEQFVDGAGEVIDVLADQLREHRASGGVFVDRAQDVLLRPRLGVDPEKLGEEEVRRAVVRDHAHESEVGDVLHRRERRVGQFRLQSRGQRAEGGGSHPGNRARGLSRSCPLRPARTPPPRIAA